jgi:hydrogenase maturation protease
MLEQSESYSRWIIVDAIAQHDHYGEILTWRWPNLPQLSPICCNTHAYSFLEVLELARALGRLPTIVDVWGISVDMHTCQSEKMGAPLSPAVELAAQELARRLQHEFAWSPTSDSGDIYA